MSTLELQADATVPSSTFVLVIKTRVLVLVRQARYTLMHLLHAFVIFFSREEVGNRFFKKEL